MEVSGTSITRECREGSSVRSETNLVISVTDTPGFFDTDISNEAVIQIIGDNIFELTTPGPHAFLIICKPERQTKEERDVLVMIQEIFGEDAVKYCIVVFTHEDQLDRGQTIKDFIATTPKSMQDLIHRCNDRYIALNNREQSHNTIQRLIQMIDEMIQQNGGEYYTNDEYRRIEREREERREAERAAQERQQRERDEALRQEGVSLLVGKEICSVLNTSKLLTSRRTDFVNGKKQKNSTEYGLVLNFHTHPCTSSEHR